MMFRLILCIVIALITAASLSAADKGSAKAFIKPLRSVFVDSVCPGADNS